MKSMHAAKTERDVIALERDNWQFGDFGLLCDGFSVWLSEQPKGEAPRQKVEIPKAVFDKMVAAYTAPQKTQRKKAT